MVWGWFGYCVGAPVGHPRPFFPYSILKGNNIYSDKNNTHDTKNNIIIYIPGCLGEGTLPLIKGLGTGGRTGRYSRRAAAGLG